MTTERLHISHLIPASPNRIYAAWLDERQQSAFTGGRATVDPWVGGRHTAWDGFVDGTLIHLETGRRIVMTWRTTEFPADAADSRVDVMLDPVAGGTKVTIDHEGIPEGQSEKYKKSWRAQFLEPMKRYFSKPEEMRAALRAASKAGVLPIPGVTSARPGARRNVVPRNEPVASEPVESPKAAAPSPRERVRPTGEARPKLERSAPAAGTAKKPAPPEAKSEVKLEAKPETKKARPTVPMREPVAPPPPKRVKEARVGKAAESKAAKPESKKAPPAAPPVRSRAPERPAKKRPTKVETKPSRAPAKKAKKSAVKKASPTRKPSTRNTPPKPTPKKTAPSRRTATAAAKAPKKTAKKASPKKAARSSRARSRA